MLSLSEVCVARGGIPVLEKLSFAVEAGTALILRGPNGIGKTTLLRALAGLQPLLAGRVEMPEESVAYASHADGVKATLSVAENLAFWARIYRRAVPETVYDDFDLGALRDRLAGSLSAGQSRRLGLARLGVIGRDVLLLDEPTVSLDARSVEMFGAFLRRRHLARGGVAVIATHIDLGLDAPVLDLAPFKARSDFGAMDEAFL